MFFHVNAAAAYKSLVVLASAGLLQFCAVTGALSGQCETPVLSGPPVWPPFIHAETPGMSRNGHLLDFVDTIFNELGQPYRVDRAKPWPRVLNELETGELDIVFAIFDTPERREKFVYSESWFADIYAVLTATGKEFEYRSVEDLLNRQGVTYGGMRFPPPLNMATEGNRNFTTVNRVELMHKMLKHNRVDYVIASVATFMSLMPPGYLRDDFRVLSASSVRIPVYMAISKKSPCLHLLEAINRQISKHRADLHEIVYSGAISN